MASYNDYQPSVSYHNTVERGVLRPYLFRCLMPDGAEGYVYVLCARENEDLLLDAIEEHSIPAFAVVVAAGAGEPDEQTRHQMERYYGFNHARVMSETL